MPVGKALYTGQNIVCQSFLYNPTLIGGLTLYKMAKLERLPA